MIGSSILQKGTSNGVITDFNGNFSINLLPNGEKTLLISMIGYIKMEVDVRTKTTIKIVLNMQAL